MNIFVTNDDGIQARGIKQLEEIAREFGKVYVMAPDRPQSGQSHAITLNMPLRAFDYGETNGVSHFACSGTPVDCVKVGLKEVFKDIKFDLLLSGINHGSNAATNVLYSGTMGAAIEGSMEGIPSIGFSTVSYDPKIDFAPTLPFMRKIIKSMIDTGSAASCWNVNMPERNIKGIKICAQAHAKWRERVLKREDPNKRAYYWIEGDFVNDDVRENTDLHYIANDYIAVVPVTTDTTDSVEMERLSSLF